MYEFRGVFFAHHVGHAEIRFFDGDEMIRSISTLEDVSRRITIIYGESDELKKLKNLTDKFIDALISEIMEYDSSDTYKFESVAGPEFTVSEAVNELFAYIFLRDKDNPRGIRCRCCSISHSILIKP